MGKLGITGKLAQRRTENLPHGVSVGCTPALGTPRGVWQSRAKDNIEKLAVPSLDITPEAQVIGIWIIAWCMSEL